MNKPTPDTKHPWDEAVKKAVKATDYCTKHQAYHGQKYKTCTPQKRIIVEITSDTKHLGLDEILEEVYSAGIRAAKNMQLPNKTGLGMVIAGDIIVSESKKLILDYIAREIIGQDELQGMTTPLQWEIAQDRNSFRAEQRKALGEI